MLLVIPVPRLTYVRTSLWLAPLLALVLAGCECSEPQEPCTIGADCESGRCIEGFCQPPATSDASPSDASSTDAGPFICLTDCGAGLACARCESCEGGETCVEVGDTCTDGDDCGNDSYCHPDLARCVPFGMPTGRNQDPQCARVIATGTFAPTVQCEFSTAPAGDAFPRHLHVLGTPMVADLRINVGPDDSPRPSIIAVFDDGFDGESEQPTGVVRILDGGTCMQQAELGSLQMVCHDCPTAIADLDADGRPDIVAFKAGGGLVAFHYDAAASDWAVLWTSTDTDGTTPFNPTGGGWAGPTIADLDDDGIPEVMRHGMVFDNEGRLLDQSLGTTNPNEYNGLFTVVADVDADGLVELVQGHGVWEWDTVAQRWSAETWFPGGLSSGNVAIADFGDYPGNVGWPASAPEVVVVSPLAERLGEIRVQTLDGVILFGPVPIPGSPEGGKGGPPTIADFDGDGRAEFASAGAVLYTVFDLDCTDSPIGRCASGRSDGVLWSQASQDRSSNVTGSSVFDFEGDGRAEAVYGDECFLRIYDGESGEVLFSQYRSSCTWYENPVIADVDGDYNAEIVIGNNYNCGDSSSGVPCRNLDPGNLDPLFAGLRCDQNADCRSGSCDAGFCRCSADSECCADCDRDGFACAAPPAGTPGTGNTCRASHPHGALGIRVYRDSADRWVRSQMIWNQHAYSVTNIDDDGTVPRSSEAAINWTTEGLNNFRQNVQGSADPGSAPDLTAGRTPLSCSEIGVAELVANICNRGAEPVGAGLMVGFYQGDAEEENRICQVPTETSLGPGSCESVTCTWDAAPSEQPGLDVTIVADDTQAEGECLERNNMTVLPGVFCQGLQ